MKVFSVVGARPQFIKAAPVSSALRRKHRELLVHTGQHYDRGMSAIFFTELGIPEPDKNLGVGSSSHGKQTSEMLAALESLMMQERPDWVLVYGDTNSTLAGALAAAKLNIRVAHVEAGLRSHDRSMPEEINRILADHCSHLLFCPTRLAVANLDREGIREGVHLVGDVMCDALLQFTPRTDETGVLRQWGLVRNSYVLATIHRAANTDCRDRLRAALACLALSPWPVLLPGHPRTVAAMEESGLTIPANVTLIEPVGYLQMLALEKNARLIMTDSGGIQKEAYMMGVPCLTLRQETEWEETVEAGWNRLVDVDVARTATALSQPWPDTAPPPVYGDGTAAMRIAELLESSTLDAQRS